MVIEEQSEGQHRGGEERLASRRAATPCHVRKGAVLYAYGEVLVRSGGCQLSSHLFFPEIEGSHVCLCAVDGIHGKIEKRICGTVHQLMCPVG